MERRDFMRLSAASAVGGLVLSQSASAEMIMAPANPLPIGAGSVFYTKEAVGRWKGKEATHLPSIEIKKAGNIVTVNVVTPHEMKGYEHYIIKHVLLDKNYIFLDEHMFNPTVDQVPMSTFTLKDYSGTLHALSMCNKHDLWLSSVKV